MSPLFHVLLFGHLVSIHPHSSTCTYVNSTVLCSAQTRSTFTVWLLFSWQQMHLCSISLVSKEYLQKWDLHMSPPPVFFPMWSVFTPPNRDTTNKERNKISYLYFCLFIMVFPQDATSYAGLDPLRSVRKIPISLVGFGLRTFWQHRNEQFTQRPKSRKKLHQPPELFINTHKDRKVIHLNGLFPEGPINLR